MTWRLAAVALSVVIAGCTSPPRTLDREIRAYVGRNITVLSAVIGDPESVHPGYSETQYTWTVDNRFVITQPRFTMYTNDISRVPFFPATPVTEDVPVHYLCNLQVITDPDGIIKTFHSSGNEGCQRFVTALNM
jgi:hypothetical protein